MHSWFSISSRDRRGQSIRKRSQAASLRDGETGWLALYFSSSVQPGLVSTSRWLRFRNALAYGGRKGRGTAAPLNPSSGDRPYANHAMHLCLSARLSARLSFFFRLPSLPPRFWISFETRREIIYGYRENQRRAEHTSLRDINGLRTYRPAIYRENARRTGGRARKASERI